MKLSVERNLNLIGYICVFIITLVFWGQYVWFFRVKEVCINELQEKINITLRESFRKSLTNKMLNDRYRFSYGIRSDEKTFIYGDTQKRKQITLSSIQDFEELGNAVFYDYLYENKAVDLSAIIKLFQLLIEEKNINEESIIMIRDSVSHQILTTTDTLSSLKDFIFSCPIPLGYEYKHYLIAALPMPSLLTLMSWQLLWQGLLFSLLIICLFWQWKIIRTTWRNAKIQTMGIAHFEHEMIKPLVTMIGTLSGTTVKKSEEITEQDIVRLKGILARLKRMSIVIDTMLTTIKTNKITIEREVIDIREEMESIREIFAWMKEYACLNIHIQENAERPLLDRVYFYSLVTNLIDNAIKYSGEHPVVDVSFRKEGGYWILTVKDNGIGMSEKEMKNVFRQFYRSPNPQISKITGCGLGLTFVKKIVDAYGGEIMIKSEVGRGSGFTVII